uniref:Uncharacterized protein n=1 Tax=Noctiluca scintillans TaxID=2966 RepID=A0A7S1AML2_NOCSC|mmetsp:Transcript_52600/g.140177  ORF Transcript_52600/g.140177 Transcript_52600/m.140177 type:complete len:299 (+) Transcript_52600:70-966(+)
MTVTGFDAELDQVEAELEGLCKGIMTCMANLRISYSNEVRDVQVQSLAAKAERDSLEAELAEVQRERDKLEQDRRILDAERHLFHERQAKFEREAAEAAVATGMDHLAVPAHAEEPAPKSATKAAPKLAPKSAPKSGTRTPVHEAPPPRGGAVAPPEAPPDARGDPWANGADPWASKGPHSKAPPVLPVPNALSTPARSDPPPEDPEVPSEALPVKAPPVLAKLIVKAPPTRVLESRQEAEKLKVKAPPQVIAERRAQAAAQTHEVPSKALPFGSDPGKAAPLCKAPPDRSRSLGSVR